MKSIDRFVYDVHMVLSQCGKGGNSDKGFPPFSLNKSEKTFTNQIKIWKKESMNSKALLRRLF